MHAENERLHAENERLRAENERDFLRAENERLQRQRWQFQQHPFVEFLNHYAPALTFLLAVAGLVWAVAIWHAEFDAVQRNLQQLSQDVRDQHHALDSIARDVSFLAGRQAERDQADQAAQPQP